MNRVKIMTCLRDGKGRKGAEKGQKEAIRLNCYRDCQIMTVEKINGFEIGVNYSDRWESNIYGDLDWSIVIDLGEKVMGFSHLLRAQGRTCLLTTV